MGVVRGSDGEQQATGEMRRWKGRGGWAGVTLIRADPVPVDTL